MESFDDIMDYDFTANLENNLIKLQMEMLIGGVFSIIFTEHFKVILLQLLMNMVE